MDFEKVERNLKKLNENLHTFGLESKAGAVCDHILHFETSELLATLVSGSLAAAFGLRNSLTILAIGLIVFTLVVSAVSVQFRQLRIEGDQATGFAA